MDQKVCTKCKVMKPLSDYHNLKTGVYGKHSNCKTCRNEYRKQNIFEFDVNNSKYKLKCIQCNKVKPFSEFYKDRSKSTGKQSYCKLCLKEKVYESASKLESYINYLLSNLKKNNDEYNEITTQDIIELYNKQEQKCALTNELLTYYNGKCLTTDKYEKKFNLKIIKINENLPVSKSNIILVGNIVSKMKSNMPISEFKRICDLIVKTQPTILSD